MLDRDRYDSLLQYYAGQVGIDWRRLKAQMLQESAANPHATSAAGAKGLFQFMDATWLDWGKLDSVWNPEASIRAGARYMAYLLRAFGNDYRKALAAYNWGLGHVTSLVSAKGDAWESGLPPETVTYLKRILG